jgi:LAO/AO transport system kinase
MSPRAAGTPSATGVVRGDRRALARLITAVENRDPSAIPALREVYKRTGRAKIIGITGPLGVGKSSLINELLKLLRSRGLTVGVVAVDPSSPFSGGSVLGDRVRIERRDGDDGVFLRSMASRGHTGGVAAATREVTRLLDAFGMDVVLVETVGSGQVDVEIREVATTSVVVLVPHLGDEVQSLKAGLFEIADVFCINKCDLAGAELAAKDLNDLASLGTSVDGWRPAVVTTSTMALQGVPELWAAIAAHEKFLDDHHLRAAGERRRLARELVGLVTERLGRELRTALDGDAELAKLLDDLVARTTDPYEAAERLYRDTRR